MTNIFLFLSMLLWAVWGIANKYAVAHAHPYTIQWMYTIPTLLFLPLWLWLSHKVALQAAFDKTAFLWAVVAAVASILASLFLYFALQWNPGSVALAVTSAYPALILAYSVITGEESLSFAKAAGVLLIIAGVILLQTAEA
jgi:drug/metabolite transporter (DMT)-like permease